MRLFKRLNTTEIINAIYSKNKLKRYFQLTLGVFISSISFNLFFLPKKFVVGGVSGISIIAVDLFNVDPSTFILITNLILIIVSLISLGKDRTLKTILGALLFPIFVRLTSNINMLINLDTADTLLIAIFAGALSGFSGGLILKTGYSIGGTEILSRILSRYKQISMGNSILFINGSIIAASVITRVSAWTMVLYAIIILYIVSVITDKVLLGISDSKAFHIVTTKEKEIEAYILDNLSHGITILNAKGGFSGKDTKVLLCIIPTRDYFKVKEGIIEIDKEAFFVVTDAYEVKGGDLTDKVDI